MNKFDEMQAEIRAKYPSVKELPLLTRMLLKLDGTYSSNTLSRSYKNDRHPDIPDRFSQTYQTVYHKGVQYFVRFGWK